MSSISRAALFLPLVAACSPAVPPPPATNIGALRDEVPTPPSDTTTLDMARAVEDALALGGLTSLASVWAGHVGSLDLAVGGCPAVFLGVPAELELDVEEEEVEQGMTWAETLGCSTPTAATSFTGFAHWQSLITPGVSGERELMSDAVVLGGDGTELFAFDGEATDTLDVAGGTYSSTLDGELSGSLLNLGASFRTGGEFAVSWADDGTFSILGSVTALDGFGPPDQRSADLEVSPELEDFPDWEAGMPRFTSVNFDLVFDPACPEEPVGYIALRGNEGFWFDVYFLPIYDPTAEDASVSDAQAFPFEQIDNVTCDGVGTLFARNVDLRALEEETPGWSRELAPNFAAVKEALPTPTLDTYVYTIRHLPLE